MNTVNKQELGPGTSLYVKLIIRQETPSFFFYKSLLAWILCTLFETASILPKDAGIETRTVTTLALASQAL
jgi:hypothetical protein